MKNIIKEMAAGYAYCLVCMFVYLILIQFHVRPYYPERVFPFWEYLVTWIIVFFGGDFIAKRVDEYVAKRTIVKDINRQGKYKVKKTKITKSKNGKVLEIEVEEKDKQGEKK